MTKPFVLGIAGPTCSGKTTLSRALRDLHRQVQVIALDSFHSASSNMQTFPSGRQWINWETTFGVDYDGIIQAVKKAIDEGASKGIHLVIVEGFLILEHPALFSLLDRVVVLQVTKNECFRRRVARKHDVPSDYFANLRERAPSDLPPNWLELYFEDAIWPSALKYSQKLVPKDPNSEKLLKESVVDKVFIINGELDPSVVLNEVVQVVSQGTSVFVS